MGFGYSPLGKFCSSLLWHREVDCLGLDGWTAVALGGGLPWPRWWTAVAYADGLQAQQRRRSGNLLENEQSF